MKPILESLAVDHLIQKLISSVSAAVPRARGFWTKRTQVWPEAWLKALMASHQNAQLAPVKIGMQVLSLDIVKNRRSGIQQHQHTIAA